MSLYNKECIDCERPMRPSRAKAANFPGTVAHNSLGRCQGCNSRYRREKAAKTIVDTDATLQSLTAYLEWRRPYRAKVGAE